MHSYSAFHYGNLGDTIIIIILAIHKCSLMPDKVYDYVCSKSFYKRPHYARGMHFYSDFHYGNLGDTIIIIIHCKNLCVSLTIKA